MSVPGSCGTTTDFTGHILLVEEIVASREVELSLDVRKTYLSAWVDGGTNAESSSSVEEHAVEQVALTGTVHAGD